jgi:hypothetical protein
MLFAAIGMYMDPVDDLLNPPVERVTIHRKPPSDNSSSS